MNPRLARLKPLNPYGWSKHVVDRRIARINAAGREAARVAGVRFTPLSRTSRKALINSCPFEAVRSEEVRALGFQFCAAHVSVRARPTPAITDTMSGQVQLTYTGIPSVIGQMKAGRLRPIAIAGDRRVAVLPDVATMASMKSGWLTAH